jgi:predicted transposase YbfD/YdcC
LRSYRRRDGRYDYPKETTFQRVLAKVDAEALEAVLTTWQDQMLGTAKEALRQPESIEEMDLVAIDGKCQRGSTPNVADEQKAQLVSAQSLPSGRVLGTVIVEKKSNEIPAARQLLAKMGPLEGKLVMLDALHTNQVTLRQIHQDNGADYLLPVKDNHPGLAALAEQHLPPPKKAELEQPGSLEASEAVRSPLGPSHCGQAANSAVRYRRRGRTQ